MSLEEGQVAVLRLHTASARPRNEGSILPPEENVCAPWHKAGQSTEEAPNFLEGRQYEVQRISLLRCWAHKGDYPPSGGTIVKLYFAATERSLATSSSLTGGAATPGCAGVPISSNIFSMPAGT
jgi:hypothetical protein